jgi:hypothetical protein
LLRGRLNAASAARLLVEAGCGHGVPDDADLHGLEGLVDLVASRLRSSTRLETLLQQAVDQWESEFAPVPCPEDIEPPSALEWASKTALYYETVLFHACLEVVNGLRRDEDSDDESDDDASDDCDDASDDGFESDEDDYESDDDHSGPDDPDNPDDLNVDAACKRQRV